MMVCEHFLSACYKWLNCLLFEYDLQTHTQFLYLKKNRKIKNDATDLKSEKENLKKIYHKNKPV